MTAVINLNILNFFKLKEQNSTTNNIRFNAFNLEKSQTDDSKKERVIDIQNSIEEIDIEEIDISFCGSIAGDTGGIG